VSILVRKTIFARKSSATGYALLAIALSLLMLPSVQVPAAEAPPEDEPRLAEIVVTAQRKQERLVDVPIAIKAINAQELDASGIKGTAMLGAAVPGLDFSPQGPAGFIYLRGVGANDANPNGEPSVATYVDGVYIASGRANQFDFLNIERIEVLKGPQGTLFGRNATGGVIQVVTRDPKHDPSAEVNLGYANYKTVSGSFYGTAGLSSFIAADVGVQFSRQYDGWGRNVLTGDDAYFTNTLSYRSKVLITPRDGTEMRLTLDFGRRDGNPISFRVLGLRVDGTPPPPGKYDASSDVGLAGYRDDFMNVRERAAAFRLDQDIGAAKLVSISSFQHLTSEYIQETDTIEPQIVSYTLPSTQESYSQEFQVLGAVGRFDWTTGIFLFQNRTAYHDGTLAFGVNGSLNHLSATQRTRSAAAYAQTTYAVTDSTKLTAGLRFTTEEARLYSALGEVPTTTTAKKFTKPTWRLVADHAFTNDLHTYVSYNRGIKGGGFDLLTPNSPGFNPEILNAYEIGLKSELLDHRLRLNSSAFFYDYSDIQVQVVGIGTVITNNAARARITGMDVDIDYVPTENLTLSGGVSLLHGKYRQFTNALGYPLSAFPPSPAFVFDASGKNTVRTPKFTGDVLAHYGIPLSTGKIIVGTIVSFNSGFDFDAANSLKQPSYTLVNATAQWVSPNKKFDVTLWGSNLLNKYYYAQGLPSGVGALTSPSPPRTYGLSVGFKL